MNILRRKEQWPIALDIGSNSIKMLQLDQANGGLSARACGQWRFPATCSNPGQRSEMIVNAVRDMLRRGDFRGRSCVSALTVDEVGIKNVRISKLPKAEMEKTLQWEAQDRFDFDVSPDRLKYIDAGQVRSGSEINSEIIMLAAPEKTINDHLAILDAAGLKPEHIYPEPLAAFRMALRSLRREADVDMVTVVLDLGTRATRVIVARGRNVVFVKTIDIGGKSFDEAVAAQLNLDIVDASELRERVMQEHAKFLSENRKSEQESCEDPRSDVDWTIRDAVRGKVEELAREIGLCLRYCSVTFRGLRPNSVIMAGGEVYDPAIMELLNDNLGIECNLAQPMRGIDVSRVMLGMGRRTPMCEWAVASGLAMRECDIAPHKKEVKNDRRLSA
ncbi:MAG: pilus assembly protein PilM [Phycisphaerales bacterium]|jgi:type IV pilus assembly protein PilM|nr:pilus assembly protein PilM [Phycisphaerales bacterium]